MSDFDIVSDLNGGDTVPTHGNDVDSTSGANIQPTQDQSQPRKIDAQTPKDTGEQPKSLRDQISSALKGEADTPDTAKKDGGVPRNPDGTFASKQTGAVSDPSAVPESTSTPPAGTGTSATPVPAGLDPTLFQSLPAETQAALARTMEDVNNRYTQQLAAHSQIEQIIAPRREAWALNGMTEAQAVNQLFALSDYATRDPAGFIQYFAQQSNVSLEDIVFGSDPVDPEVNSLKQEIEQLKSQLTGFSTSQQEAAHQQTVNNIMAFFDAKDDKGTPLRPHAVELGQNILPFIQAVRQQFPQYSMEQTLQEAYDRACWGTPSVRAKMQEAANAAADAERMRAQQDTAAKKRNASVSVPPGTPTVPPPSPKDGSMSLRDTIKASMASAN